MLVAVEYKRKIQPNRISNRANAYWATINWIAQPNQIAPIPSATTPYITYILPTGS